MLHLQRREVLIGLASVTLAQAVFGRTGAVLAADGQEVWRFDAVNRHAALPPGNYVVEIDDQKIQFAGTEGQYLEVK